MRNLPIAPTSVIEQSFYFQNLTATQCVGKACSDSLGCFLRTSVISLKGFNINSSLVLWLCFDDSHLGDGC